MEPLSHRASILIRAGASDLYAMVADISRMGEWSPTCVGGWWDDDSERGIGAWFTGRNVTPERTWETRSLVVAADPGREFAFVVGGDRVRWGYRFESRGELTEVTESWDFLPGGLAYFAERFGSDAAAQRDSRARLARVGIDVTLAALKAIAERP